MNGNPVYTRQPFPNNIIPASRLSPQALLIEQGFSLAECGGNGQFLGSREQLLRQPMVRWPTTSVCSRASTTTGAKNSEFSDGIAIGMVR